MNSITGKSSARHFVLVLGFPKPSFKVDVSTPPRQIKPKRTTAVVDFRSFCVAVALFLV